MQRKMWNLFVMILVPINSVFGGHVYKDYKNNADVIRPVYNSMRASLQQDFDSSLNKNEIMSKRRLKRSPIPLKHDYNEVIRRSPLPFDHNEYYDTQASESNNDWAVVNSQGYPFSDLVCTRRSEAQTHITVSDPHTIATPSFWNIALLAKYAFILFVAFWVKAILFKLLIIPLKVLFGLKVISFINSLLLGALLFKSKFRKSYLPYPYPYVTSPGTPVVSPLPGTTPVTSSSSSAASSAANDPFDDEYVDVVRPGEDLKRILEYVKRRNKNW